MKTSLILVSKDEEKHIPGFLESLEKQTRKPDEIILVDSSSDSTPELMRPYVTKLITIEPRGCGQARITAIENSTGDIIVFTDFDEVLYPDWFEKLLRPFEDQSVMVVQGRVFTKNYDGSDEHGIFSDGLAEHGKYICGCNVAFRRSVLDEFQIDPHQTWEDIELGYRISKKYDIYGARDAIVYHYGPSPEYTKNRDVRNSALWSGVGWSRILLKHKNLHWFLRIYYNIFNVILAHGFKTFLYYFYYFHYALLHELMHKPVKKQTGDNVRKVI